MFEYGQQVKIAVVIPCYKVKRHILNVIQDIGEDVSAIYVIDDCCPENSGDFVKMSCPDQRVSVIRHHENLGVGGAVLTGYKAALDHGMDIIVKIDGDGQMDPHLIPKFIAPILHGSADYTKGNRFFNLEKIHAMPKLRLLGNAVLSFMSKCSSGYWNLFDPTNGFTAIHRDVARLLPFNKISQRFFFETDMLFRLNTLRAVVIDVPMDAKYANESSNLKISNIVSEFFLKHMRNLGKRIFYNYYLRDMSLASIELPLGLGLLSFGIFFGLYHWMLSIHQGVPTPAGTVMFSALPVIIGLQFVLAFLNYDMNTVPTMPISQFKRHQVKIASALNELT